MSTATDPAVPAEAEGPEGPEPQTSGLPPPDAAGVTDSAEAAPAAARQISVAISHSDWLAQKGKRRRPHRRRRAALAAMLAAAILVTVLLLLVVLSPGLPNRLGLAWLSRAEPRPTAVAPGAASPSTPAPVPLRTATGQPVSEQRPGATQALAPAANSRTAEPAAATETLTGMATRQPQTMTPPTTPSPTLQSSPAAPPTAGPSEPSATLAAVGMPSPAVTTATPASPAASGAMAPSCHLLALQPVRAYERPSRQDTAYSTLAPGLRFPVAGQTAHGWLGFDPGPAPAGLPGIFRLRWALRSDAIRLEGECADLPFLAGPPAGICFAIALDGVAVYSGPSADSAAIAHIEPGAYAAVTAVAGGWAHLDLSLGSLTLEHWGWAEAGSLYLDGPCSDLPQQPTAVHIGVTAGQGSVYHPGQPLEICYLPSRPFYLKITVCQPGQACAVYWEIEDAEGSGGCLPWTVTAPLGRVVLRVEAFEAGRAVARDETYFFVQR